MVLASLVSREKDKQEDVKTVKILYFIINDKSFTRDFFVASMNASRDNSVKFRYVNEDGEWVTSEGNVKYIKELQDEPTVKIKMINGEVYYASKKAIKKVRVVTHPTFVPIDESYPKTSSLYEAKSYLDKNIKFYSVYKENETKTTTSNVTKIEFATPTREENVFYTDTNVMYIVP